jgi:type I restriction enzyme S subunit
LGNLIAKKQNIKQATMQVLLTGRKRLKGFTNEWRKISLNKIGDTYGGLSGKTKKDFENGKFAYITFLNVMNNPVIDINAFDMVNLSVGENQNKVQKGDLLFNGSSETPEEVGMCSAMLKEFPDLYLNSFCFGFRLKKELKNDPLYLSYYFRSKQGRKHFYSLAQGATRYNLSKSNFLQLEILLPEPNEQKALAELFWDMTKEIEALQQQYSKYKLMKQGMLQNLLTGKVRLTNT